MAVITLSNPKSEVMVLVEGDSGQTMYIVEYCKGIPLLDYRCWWLSYLW